MTEGELFTLIYPIVPLVGMAGFVPQILTLLAMKEAPKSISLLTWYIWTCTWLVSFGYAVFALQDLLFTLTCGMNLIGHCVIIGLTVYKRQKYDAASVTTRAGIPVAQPLP